MRPKSGNVPLGSSDVWTTAACQFQFTDPLCPEGDVAPTIMARRQRGYIAVNLTD